jgi:hypothetical protein
MIGNAGYLKAMEETGVLDCTMYTAGELPRNKVSFPRT